jgi:hypothetical protein
VHGRQFETGIAAGFRDPGNLTARKVCCRVAISFGRVRATGGTLVLVPTAKHRGCT